MPGRHAAPAGRSFYRDLFTMLGGIVAVGAIVFLGLSALSTGQTPESTATTALVPTTTTTLLTTTSSPTTASTTASTTTTTSATTTTVALKDPSEIRVRVLNGVGIAGLASEISSELQALGYEVLEPGNYPILPQSRVWYAEGFEGEALQLAAEFPDARVEPADADLDVDGDIVVVLGESHEDG